MHSFYSLLIVSFLYFIGLSSCCKDDDAGANLSETPFLTLNIQDFFSDSDERGCAMLINQDGVVTDIKSVESNQIVNLYVNEGDEEGPVAFTLVKSSLNEKYFEIQTYDNIESGEIIINIPDAAEPTEFSKIDIYGVTGLPLPQLNISYFSYPGLSHSYDQQQNIFSIELFSDEAYLPLFDQSMNELKFIYHSSLLSAGDLSYDWDELLIIDEPTTIELPDDTEFSRFSISGKFSNGGNRFLPIEQHDISFSGSRQTYIPFDLLDSIRISTRVNLSPEAHLITAISNEKENVEYSSPQIELDVQEQSNSIVFDGDGGEYLGYTFEFQADSLIIFWHHSSLTNEIVEVEIPSKVPEEILEFYPVLDRNIQFEYSNSYYLHTEPAVDFMDKIRYYLNPSDKEKVYSREDFIRHFNR